jgi:hypothetical protein
VTHSFKIYTIDPKNPTEKKIEVIIPGDLSLRWYKYHPVKYENLRAARAVLDAPKRIYTGIRAINEGGYCYIGRPETWYIKEDTEVPFPTNKVFAVYLSDRMCLYDFAAEYVDKEDSLSPKDWKNRFTGLLWQSTS